MLRGAARIAFDRIFRATARRVAFRIAVVLGMASLSVPFPLGPVGVAAAARSTSGPVEIVADELEYREDEEVYLARGHVRIVQQGRTLVADRVMFSNRTRSGIASGNVEMIDGGDTLRADFVHFDVDTLLGSVFEGELDSTDSAFRMSGREVRKTGEKTYHFEEGRFTTCRCPEEGRDPWTLTAEEADLEIEGYGTARNATLEVLDVPVLWAPWMIYPLKRERQSGFLAPHFSRSSRSGFTGGVPFFWAVRDNVNLILQPEYQQRRGFKPSADLEYVFGERSQGNLYGTFIHDISVDPSDRSTPYSQDRWASSWLHSQALPADFELRIDAAAMSDNDVPFDFEFGDASERFLESAGFFDRRSGPLDRFAATAGVRVADDLQNPNNEDRDSFMQQRLPEVMLGAVAGPVPMLPGLVASADLEYANFRPYHDQEKELPTSTRVGDLFYDIGIDGIPFSMDGPSEGDGLFEEGEAVADRGQRVIANPRLSYPLRLLDRLELVPEVGYHGTFYDTEFADFEQRNLMTARVDLSSRVRGEVELPFGIGSAVHTMEPKVGWAYITGTGQGDNPLLVPQTAVPQKRLRQLSPENRTRDSADRIDDLSAVILSLANRLVSPGSGMMLGELMVSSEYRFSDREWGLLILEGEAARVRGVKVRFHGGWDLEKSVVSEGLVNASWTHATGHELGLGYRYLRDIPQVFEAFNFDERFDEFEEGFGRINQIRGVSRAQLNPRWALTYRGFYSFENNLSLRHLAGVEYLSACRCWAIRLEVDSDRTRGIGVNLQYRLLAFGDDGGRLFGGSRDSGSLFDAFGDL